MRCAFFCVWFLLQQRLALSFLFGRTRLPITASYAPGGTHFSRPRASPPFSSRKAIHAAGITSAVSRPPLSKPGILLLNLGGPQKSEDVQEFLYNLFADPDIIRLPCKPLTVLQKPIAYLISSNRAPKSIEAYNSIGGGSPILQYTTEQAELLQNKLRSHRTPDDSSGNRSRGNIDWSAAKCYIAMRYFQPYTEQALMEMERDGITDLIVLPLYPHYSISTSGSSLKKLKELFGKKQSQWSPSVVKQTVVPAWYYRPGYVKMLAKLLLNEIAVMASKLEGSVSSPGAATVSPPPPIDVLYSAHGVPRTYIEEAGDPYKRQIEHNSLQVSREVRRQMQEALNRGETNMNWALFRPIPLSSSSSSSHSSHPQKEHKGAEEDSSSSSSSDTILGGVLSNVKSVLSTLRTELLGAPPLDAAPPSVPELPLDPFPPSRMCPSGVNFHLAYQSRVGPIEWLRPYTDDKIRQMKAKNLIMMPIAFVSEHIETLEEIDQEYRELAEENGLQQWGRVPAPNTDPDFISEMADIVVEAVEGGNSSSYSLKRACSVECTAAYIDSVSGGPEALKTER